MWWPHGKVLLGRSAGRSPGDPLSWNRYPYGRNDPIDITDPSGKSFGDFVGSLINGLMEGLAYTFGGPAGYAWAKANSYAYDGEDFNPVGGFGHGMPSGSSWNGTPIYMPNPGIAGALGLPTMADLGGPINNATTTVTTDFCNNQAALPGFRGGRVQLTAKVTDDNSIAYNWKQTVTTSNLGGNTDPTHRPNVPFNDHAPGTDLYWSGSDQQGAAAEAAKRGATTLFRDAPQRFGGVPYTWKGKVSLIGIGKNGKRTRLWTGTWSMNVTATTSTVDCSHLGGH